MEGGHWVIVAKEWGVGVGCLGTGVLVLCFLRKEGGIPHFVTACVFWGRRARIERNWRSFREGQGW